MPRKVREEEKHGNHKINTQTTISSSFSRFALLLLGRRGTSGVEKRKNEKWENRRNKGKTMTNHVNNEKLIDPGKRVPILLGGRRENCEDDQA